MPRSRRARMLLETCSVIRVHLIGTMEYRRMVDMTSGQDHTIGGMWTLHMHYHDNIVL